MSDLVSSLSHVNGNTASGASKTQILLPDERRLEIWVQPRLLSSELQDIVASHFNLKEREYFGLCFRDDTSHWLWLQPSHRVLDHDFPKRSHGPLQLRFAVKFFLEHVHSLHDSNAVELFYLHAQSLVVTGDLECDSVTVFRLAAYVLQVKHGDYSDDEKAREHLKKMNAFPIKVLKQHLSLKLCESHVIDCYRDLVGSERGDAVLEYLGIVEKLPTYGMHIYDVKDKSGLPWWLGVSFRGIYQFDFNDRRVPRKYFSWQLLQNLYYRDKKFTIEILESKSVSESRRSFMTSNVTFSWWAPTTQLTKAIWCMAVAQHQFNIKLVNGLSKSNHDSVGIGSGTTKSKSLINAQRHRTEVAHELTHRRHSFSKLPSYDERVRILAARSQSSLASAASLNLSGSDRGDSCRDLSSFNEQDEVVHLRRRYEQLKERKENRRLQLQEKLKRLKQVCLEEAEITGELPSEYPRHDGEPLPSFRRRVRTTYALNPHLLVLKDGADEFSSAEASCFNSSERLCMSTGDSSTVEVTSVVSALQNHETTQIRHLELELQVQRNKAAALRRVHSGARSRHQRKITLAEQIACEERVVTLERQLRDLRHHPLLSPVQRFQSLLHTLGVTQRLSSASSTGELRHCGADSHSLCSELSLGALSCGGMPSSQGSLHRTGTGGGGYVSFQPARGYRAMAFPTLLSNGGAGGAQVQPLTDAETIMSTQSADSGFVDGSKQRLLNRTISNCTTGAVQVDSGVCCVKQLLRRSVSDPQLASVDTSSHASSPADDGYNYSTIAASLACQRYSLASTDCSSASGEHEHMAVGPPPPTLRANGHDRNLSPRRINSTLSLPSNVYLGRPTEDRNDLEKNKSANNYLRHKLQSDSDAASGSLASDFSREMLNWIEKKDRFCGTDA